MAQRLPVVSVPEDRRVPLVGHDVVNLSGSDNLALALMLITVSSERKNLARLLHFVCVEALGAALALLGSLALSLPWLSRRTLRDTWGCV
jgi:hypothetical protein